MARAQRDQACEDEASRGARGGLERRERQPGVKAREEQQPSSTLTTGGSGVADETRKLAMIELSSFSSFVGGSLVFHLFWLLVGPLGC